MNFVKLNSICRKFDYGHTASATTRDTGHKFLRITDIQNGFVDWERVPFCECNEDVAKKYRLAPGDIVFARTGSVGNTSLIESAPYEAVFASYLIRIRPNKELVFPKFLAYYFRSQHYWTQIESTAVGAINKGINATTLKELSVPLPPLPEQDRIVALLDKADRIYRLYHFALHLGNSYVQSVFLKMFGDPVTNPMGWEIKSLGSKIKSIRYGTGSPPGEYLENGIPFIRATNIKGGTIIENDMAFISEGAAKGIEKCQIQHGNLLIVRSGINTGDCALVPITYDRAYAAYDLIVEIDFPYNVFYNVLINSIYGKAVIGPISRRAGQPHLNASQVKSLTFPFPPLSFQEKFAQVLQRYERLRSQQQEALRQSEHLFQSLLSMIFNGGL